MFFPHWMEHSMRNWSRTKVNQHGRSAAGRNQGFSVIAYPSWCFHSARSSLAKKFILPVVIKNKYADLKVHTIAMFSKANKGDFFAFLITLTFSLLSIFTVKGMDRNDNLSEKNRAIQGAIYVTPRLFLLFATSNQEAVVNHQALFFSPSPPTLPSPDPPFSFFPTLQSLCCY